MMNWSPGCDCSGGSSRSRNRGSALARPRPTSGWPRSGGGDVRQGFADHPVRTQVAVLASVVAALRLCSAWTSRTARGPGRGERAGGRRHGGRTKACNRNASTKCAAMPIDTQSRPYWSADEWQLNEIARSHQFNLNVSLDLNHCAVFKPHLVRRSAIGT